jgi:hypothetical protein
MPCQQAASDDDCWTTLCDGFFVPVDDVRDLLPPVEEHRSSEAEVNLGAGQDDGSKATRPDLIFVSPAPRKGLLFRFAEVKYRRHLRTARSPEALQSVREQVESLRERWDEWYGATGAYVSFRAVRLAKLARVLRFYADKARRHASDEEGVGLTRDGYQSQS